MTLGKLLEKIYYSQEIEVRLKNAIDGDLIFSGEAWRFTTKNPDYEKYAKKRIRLLATYNNALIIVLK